MTSKAIATPSESLKAKHKLVAEAHAEPSRVRLHRAISWLKRAEQEGDDSDAQFVFLWIAFNAAYAKEFGFETTERVIFGKFIATLLSIDQNKRLHQLMFAQFTGPIRTMVENKFVF